MNNRLDIVRYGSPSFTYLVSLLIYSDLAANICYDTASLITFAAVTLVIAFTLLGVTDSKGFYISDSRLVRLVLLFAALFSVVYEFIGIHRVFQHSSDFTSTKPGLYVLALVIISISAICSVGGAYTAVKVSNIIYIIPCIVFILILASGISGGIIHELTGLYSDRALSSILRGGFSSLILYADIFIIIFMQKKENCYSRKEILTSVIFSLMLVIGSSLVLRWLFGAVLFQRLKLPFVSAVGIIPGFSFDEIIAFAISVCILYRLICKQCFCVLLIGEMLRTDVKKARIICYVIFSLLGILGTNMYIARIDDSMIILPLSLLNLFAFIFLPLISQGKHKESSSTADSDSIHG